MNNRWTDAQKQEIIEYAEKHSKAAAKRKFGVCTEAINYWTKDDHRKKILQKQQEDYRKNHLNSKYTCKQMRFILEHDIEQAIQLFEITEKEYKRIKQYITRTEAYRKKNKDKIYARTRKWFKDNKEHVKKKEKQYIEENREKIRARIRHKKKTDPAFKLKENVRRRMWGALKQNEKDNHTEDLLGCTVEEFKIYLEQQFTSEMTWDNYGPVWHIDHIKPLSLFDLSDPKEQYSAFNYTNCQPLLAHDNLKKSNIYEE